jgi:hypothetical protein
MPLTRSPPVMSEKNEQPPLGPHPDYDEVLDLAVEYTFPCSDPIAVEACCAKRKASRNPGPDQDGSKGRR